MSIMAMLITGNMIPLFEGYGMLGDSILRRKYLIILKKIGLMAGSWEAIVQIFLGFWKKEYQKKSNLSQDTMLLSKDGKT